MPLINKRVTFDDADIPNQPLAPPRPDYRSNDWQPPARRQIGPRATLFTIGAGAIVGALIVYLAIRLANYVAAVNAASVDGFGAPTLDVFLLNTVKIVAAGAIVVVLCAMALAPIVYLAQRAIVRMQNSQPVSVFDVLGGWRRDRAYTFSRDALGWYHSERRQWANASLYWSLNSLDMSRREALRQPYGGDYVDGIVTDDNQPPQLPALRGQETMIEHLLTAGLINRSGNSLLVGMRDQKPQYIELDETGFIALAGMPRVGKSSTACLIAAQVALIPDSVIIVCDKHGRKSDSLLTRLAPIAHRLARAAIETSDIIDAIDYWHEIGSNRLLEDDNTKHIYPPCFLIIDEFTAMILLSLLPASTLNKLVSAAVEFPKVQAHGLIIGHQWTGKLLGTNLGAPLRRVTTQRIIHRIDPQDAEFLIPNSYAKQCQTLSDGRAIFMGASQPTPIELTVPYMTADDMAYVARLLPLAPGVAQRSDRAFVASVADVASALQSEDAGGNVADLDPDDDPPGAADVPPEQFDTDRRTRLAKLLLVRRTAGGKFQYSYRDVQALSNLRTATICALAIEVGRAGRASNRSN